MNTLIIIAHPGNHSITHEVADEVTATLNSKDCQSTRLDLYRQNFNPVLSKKELDTWNEGQISQDAIEHQKLIASHQGLIMIFPVWWNAPPAILLGWMQRVLSKGFAFDYPDGSHLGLLKNPVQLIINSGSSNPEYAPLYVDPIAASLNYCGIKKVLAHVNYGMHEQLDEKAKNSVMCDVRLATEKYIDRLNSKI